MDEIVITPSSLDFPQYDLLSSPIHFCDNSIQSDENSTTTHANNDEFDATSFNQLTTNSCTIYKNSTSRRMEYSMRGMKLSGSNPSQDSAFGSMTDGEQSIASSSLRLSSFQSISSPIDEGVEDVTTLSVESTPQKCASNSSSPGKENCTFSDYNQQTSTRQKIARSTSEKKIIENAAITLDPPKILVTDQSSFYTTSPSKACGTVEVFSQKYRVSSFEDMSTKRTSLRHVNKIAFRSLEDERRIDSAFTPIPTTNGCGTDTNNRAYAYNNGEKVKKLTHAAFSRKICSTKEKHTKWKNSILARKNNLIKSNESLLDQQQRDTCGAQTLKKRVHSTNEIHDCAGPYESDSLCSRPSISVEGFKNFPTKSRSERYLFSLNKLKQTAINDYEEDENDGGKHCPVGVYRPEVVSFIDASSSSDSSPSRQDICQIIGGFEPDPCSAEEKTPLLEGMEMSPISPNESDEML